MYPAWKLNKQGDTMQPWSTLFLIWNQSVVMCPVLTVASWHTDFSGGRSGGLVFPYLQVFSTVCCDPHKDFGVVNEAEVDVFLELYCFFDDPADVGKLVSGASLFSETSLNIGSSHFTYCWSLAQRLWGITLIACEMSAIEQEFEHSLAFAFWDKSKVLLITSLFPSSPKCDLSA